MLQKHGHYNDLSPELRTKLEEKTHSFGKRVRYKFNISHENPDPQKYNGPIIWPFMYALQPCTFRITDPNETRKDISKSKQIGLVDKTDKDGKPETFQKIKVWERHRGILTFDLTEPSDVDMVMYLELHPKLKDGQFADKDKHHVVERIDERAEAKFKKERRDAIFKAQAVAREMSEEQIKQFADAMMWDSTEDIDILKDKVEEMTQENPEVFNDLVSDKKMEYQAVIKRALDKQIWAFDPAEYKIIWTSNQQTVTVLQPVGEKNHVEKAAEWLMTGGQKCDEIYKKVKNLVK
jgi:hypothetical protein